MEKRLVTEDETGENERWGIGKVKTTWVFKKGQDRE